MIARGKLVEEWKAKLAESQGADAAPAPRVNWLRKVQGRLYRFLVSFYGRGDWNAARIGESKPASESPSAVTLLVDQRDGTRGKEPRSPGHIRAVLKKLHVANDRLQPPKPAPAPLSSVAWMVVYSTDSKYKLQRWVERLHQVEIPARYVVQGAHTQLQVPMEHYGAALEFIKAHQHKLLPERRLRTPYTLLAQVVGAVVGSFPGMCVGHILGLIIVDLFQQHERAISEPGLYALIWTTVGAIVGAVCGAIMATTYSSSTLNFNPPAPGDGWKVLKVDGRRYSVVRIVELLALHGIESRYALLRENSVIQVKENQLQAAKELLSENLASAALLRTVQSRSIRLTTFKETCAILLLLLSGGFIVVALSEYAAGSFSLLAAAVLTSIGVVVAVGVFAVLIRERYWDKIDANK